MRRIIVNVLVIIGMLLLAGCESTPSKPIPDVSNIAVDLNLIRYDEALTALDPQKPEDSYLELLRTYPHMTDLYFKKLLTLHDVRPDTLYARIASFRSDQRITALGEKVASSFKNMDSIKKELTKAFKFYKYYFPEKAVPNIYTLYTEFGYQPFIFNDKDGDGIGVGLDMFLGNDFDYKKYNPTDPIFSNYLTRTYNKEHLTKKTMEIAIIDVLDNPSGRRFIDLMIYEGKKLYILDKLMPTTPDTIIHEYTPVQLQWVKENELQIWDFFLEKNLMYETNNFELSKYLQHSPTTKGMPSVSPGRTACYMGYKIVKAFMDRQKLSVQELVDFKDSQLLLEQSKYKPARKRK